MTKLKIALLGIGGFPENYVHAMEKPQREGLRLVGAVDPYVRACPLCPVYATPEELYRAFQPDIVVVGTPIQFHTEHAVEAFAHGCHVVLEKPIAATAEGARRILAARDIGSVPPEQTRMDQWQAQILARVMEKATCFFVTGEENRKMIEDMHMRWAGDVDTALAQATALLGEDSSVVVIPDGVGVIVGDA